MKIVVVLTFVSILLVSACDSSYQDQADVPTPGATQSESTVYNYRCDSGETIAASYPSTESATVQYNGNGYNMKITVSGSGARYVGGELEWWTKGSGPDAEGTLFRHNADGTTGESIELCTELQMQSNS